MRRDLMPFAPTSESRWSHRFAGDDMPMFLSPVVCAGRTVNEPLPEMVCPSTFTLNAWVGMVSPWRRS